MPVVVIGRRDVSPAGTHNGSKQACTTDDLGQRLAGLGCEEIP
jgi:hypothetical protein